MLSLIGSIKIRISGHTSVDVKGGFISSKKGGSASETDNDDNFYKENK